MLKKILLTLGVIWVSTCQLTWAQAEAPVPPPPTVEPMPNQDLEPEVTITTREGEPAEEYRINGKLYMIKVTPKVGPSYYLYDQTGSGNFSRFDDMPVGGLKPPQWILLRW